MEQFNIQQGVSLFMVNAKLHGSHSFAKHERFTADQNGYLPVLPESYICIMYGTFQIAVDFYYSTVYCTCGWEGEGRERGGWREGEGICTVRGGGGGHRNLDFFGPKWPVLWICPLKTTTYRTL